MCPRRLTLRKSPLVFAHFENKVSLRILHPITFVGGLLKSNLYSKGQISEIEIHTDFFYQTIFENKKIFFFSFDF